jgi:hypothetical protein
MLQAPATEFISAKTVVTALAISALVWCAIIFA